MKSRNLPENHPLRKAQWIWPGSGVYLHNCFAHFRYDFTMDSVPEKAPFFITADKSYRLYVNGKYVCRGPARGFQSHWPFDEVDLAGFLRAGANWLSIEAYNPGISTFQYVHMSVAGILCAAEWPGVSIHSDNNDPNWNFGRSKANATETAMLSRMLEFQEDFDASLDDASWISSPDFKKSLWNMIPCREKQWNGVNFGRPPYDTVEARGVPLLSETIVAPGKPLLHGASDCADGWRTCDNITWHFQLNEFEGMTWSDASKSIEAKRSSSVLELSAPATGKGRFSATTFDLGKNLPGVLLVEVEGGDGSEVIDFHYHQRLLEGKPVFEKVLGDIIAMSSRLRLAAGHCRHEFYHIMGIRGITMQIRNAAAPLKIKLSWRTALYPFTMKGTFESSDKLLNGIHEICRHTQQICSLDSYVDTPWREQGQWWGDARIQIRNTIYLDGDMRLAERGIDTIADQPERHGLTYALAPIGTGGCILPDFSLTWILTVWDYYWQTGDLSLFRKHHSRIKGILEYFASPELRTKDGLLLYDKRFWLFEDWGPIPKDPIPSFLNLWHLYTLRHYLKLLQTAGVEAEAKSVAKEIDERSKLLSGKLFNPEKGLFESCLDLDGHFVGTPSVHDQVLGLLLDLHPEAKDSMLAQRILPYIREEKLDCAVPTAFWASYLIECLDKLGLGKEAIDFIRAKWSPMIPYEGVWEGFDYLNHDGCPSCSHAWSAHPSFHLVNILAGLRQRGVAWEKAEWNPCLCKEVAHASATVPTPKGLLKASWKRSGDSIEAHLEIPEGMEVSTKLKGAPMPKLPAGVYDFKA